MTGGVNIPFFQPKFVVAFFQLVLLIVDYIFAVVFMVFSTFFIIFLSDGIDIVGHFTLSIITNPFLCVPSRAQQKRSFYVYHDAIPSFCIPVNNSHMWSYTKSYDHLLHRFQYICIPSVYQEKPFTNIYTDQILETAHITFHCLSVKSDQTFLVVFGLFCESNSFLFIKLVYVYQIFPYTIHIPINFIFKNFRDHTLILNSTSSYIIIVFPSKIYIKKLITKVGNHNFIILTNFYRISLSRSINF